MNLYFRYKEDCDVYVVYHEEVVATSVCGRAEKISVIMPTKIDYKKLYKYLSVNNPCASGLNAMIPFPPHKKPFGNVILFSFYLFDCSI